MITIKRHIRNLTALVLSVVVLLGTSGFKIYSHHCNNANIHNYSILIPANQCSHNTDKANKNSCCKLIDKSCCEQLIHKTNDGTCCTNSEEYIKLDIETLLNYTAPQIKLSDFALLIFFLSVIKDADIYASPTLYNQYIKKTIPPLSTHQFLSHIQVYLI